MSRAFCVTLVSLLGTMANAETLVANRIIPANTIIEPGDVRVQPMAGVAAVVSPDDVIGKEARKALFAGRPILLSDVGMPAVVERNQIIQLVFQRNGLVIKTDGRALDRAGPGETVRVMNLASRSIVMADLDERGVGYVSQ